MLGSCLVSFHFLWAILCPQSVVIYLTGHANFIREYYGDVNKYVVETDDDGGTGGRSTDTTLEVEIETIVDTGDNFV